jgi:hypothetical protein
MLGVYLLAAALATPSPPPLKTIGHAHASPFCSALREQVGTAVRALLENKPVIGQGKDIFLDMARDLTRGNGRRIDLDMERVNGLVTPMVQNLAATDAALDKLQQETKSHPGEDDAKLAQIRAQLEAVADDQRKMLNVFSGTYYSFKSNELLGRGNPLGNAISPQASSSTKDPSGTDSADNKVAFTAPSPSAAPSAAPLAVGTGGHVDMGLLAGTPFAKMYDELTDYQLEELTLESQSAESIVHAAALCQ